MGNIQVITSHIERIRRNRYNFIHKNEAKKALKNIEKDSNYKLSIQTRRKIDNYALEVFGSKAYAPWLYVYTAYNQGFLEGWIPDNYFGHVVAPKINKDIRRIANVKTLTKKIIQTDSLPDICYLIHGESYDLNLNLITKNVAAEIIFERSEQVYLKKDNSNKGRGVVKVSKEKFKQLDFNEIRDAVFQKPIIQMEWFDEIMKDSVATIRVNTVYNNGIAKKNAAFLRTGRMGSDIIKASESIKIPIIDDKGSLDEKGTGPNWERYRFHPDSKYKFANNKIPNFNDVVKECEQLHQKLPHFKIISWDATVNYRGEVKIMEWNTNHPGTKFTEPALGPNFKALDWDLLWR